MESSQLLTPCWDSKCPSLIPVSRRKGTREQTLQHIPGLADFGMSIMRHALDVQNLQSRNSQGNSVWALVPNCKMLVFEDFQRSFWKKLGGFVSVFSLKHKESVLSILNICHDCTWHLIYDLIKIKLYLLVRRCKFWLFKLSNLFQQFSWKEK